ncbi:MAG: ATP-binding cassette domain-containing protein [Hellea sp.]|nr:ATP-binding cassette domain-containing protein [Hellea sp.]
MSPPLLTLNNIALTFGSTPLLTDANMMVYSGDRLCVVGRNGSGKSTFLKLAAGLIEPDAGTRFVKPGVTARYLPQEPNLSQYSTIGDYIRSGLEGAEQGYKIPYYLDALDLDESSSTAHLSGGESRRAALVRTLATEPDILMLDEPTNHLDLPAIEWLESELSSMRSAIILISHDRRFLEKLSRKTIWMDRGETRDIDSGFAEFENWRDNFLEQEELERHKLDRKIVREQHWIVHGVSGRRKRNIRRVKELASLRQSVNDQRHVKGNVQFAAAEGSRSGKLVAELNNISKFFSERPIVYDFSIRIMRGERIGLVGPNGAGKTTLLKMMIGHLEPDNGSIKHGSNLEPLIVDQKRESLNPDWTLSEALTDGRSENVIIGDKSVHVQRYMKDFLFLPEQARTPVHALSGGERGRLQLARGLRLASNLLVLDEPTNDLDLETLDLLQELIADYDGTVLLVSHDRDFLDRTVTRTIAFEEPGLWQIYAGGYTDMTRQRGETRTALKEKTIHLKAKKQATSSGSQPPKKLSYKHQFRLEQIPSEIKYAEKNIAELEITLADPELFTSDPGAFTKTAAQLEQMKDKLDMLETEWLELEAMKDTL